VEQLQLLLEHLAQDAHAPTAVRDPGRAVDQHIADSLVALEIDAVRDAQIVADVGSGAGFPGVPLAVAKPGAEVRLVESSARACGFLERLVQELGLGHVTVINARAEDWPEGTGAHDLVTSRAVAPLPVVLEYAAPLLCPNGALVLWRGDPRLGEAEAGQAAAAVLGLESVTRRPVSPFAGARNRFLDLYLKVRDTPARFPRRPGAAAKRPLSFPKSTHGEKSRPQAEAKDSLGTERNPRGKSGSAPN
jgi:16S rRNA (guanine527-N7)-methyltransferase